MGETCYYKAGVVGSIPAAATNWFVTQLARVPVFYTGSSGFESLQANKL